MLFVAALVAGFIDAIAGGGGLVTLPALLLTGLPSLQVLATNKAQSMCGTFMAVTVMIRKKMVRLAEMKMFIIYVAMGSALGTVIVQWIDKETLQFIVPIVLIVMTFYVLLSPKASDIDAEPRVKEPAFRWICSAIGMYDGILGPGTGSMFALSHVGLRGYAIKVATARAKVLNLTSNMASFILFLIGGHVVWSYAAVMVCGQMIGGYVGAHTVISNGTKIIKPMIAMTSVGMLMKYCYTVFFS